MKEVKVIKWKGRDLEDLAHFLNVDEIEQDFLESDITLHNKGQSVFVSVGQYIIQDCKGVLGTANTELEARLISELVANGHAYIERQNINKEQRL